MKKIIWVIFIVFLGIVCMGCPNPAGNNPPPVQWKLGLTMVTVPAGTYQRNATVGNLSTVSADFQMSEKEITMEQFVLVTGLANPSPSFGDLVQGPVQNVTWYHAVVFCNKLSIAEGLTPVYSIMVSGSANTNPDAWGTIPVDNLTPAKNALWDAVQANWSANGYRLPTVMEWMWAAQGATSGYGSHVDGKFTNGYLKEFAGDPDPTTVAVATLIDSYAWTSRNSGDTPHPVGTTDNANELGLFDMSGNVWEWCWDWYENPTTHEGALISDALDDSGRGPSTGVYRDACGGFWGYSSFRLDFWGCHYPYIQLTRHGFRVVRN